MLGRVMHRFSVVASPTLYLCIPSVAMWPVPTRCLDMAGAHPCLCSDAAGPRFDCARALAQQPNSSTFLRDLEKKNRKTVILSIGRPSIRMLLLVGRDTGPRSPTYPILVHLLF
jgi:hypothetical protein